MTKIKKRNELSIFNDFRIKPPTTSIDIKDYPKEKDLHSLQLLCKVDKNNKPTSWWKKNIKEVVKVRIGYRANEGRRANNMIKRTNENSNAFIKETI